MYFVTRYRCRFYIILDEIDPFINHFDAFNFVGKHSVQSDASSHEGDIRNKL